MATSKTEYIAKKEGRQREPERRGRCLCLDITGDATCKRLVKYVSKLCVYQNRKLRSVSQLGLDNLKRLEECWVWDCREMEYIIISEGKENTFPHLQLLHLERLPRLERIFSCNNVVAAPSSLNLRKINLCECNTIQFVFRKEMISQLGCLEELEVSHCRSLKGIIEVYLDRDVVAIDRDNIFLRGAGTFSNEGRIVLPNLRCISLTELRELENLWSIDLSLPSLVEIKIRQCRWLMPSRLTNELVPKLQVIEAEEQWWESLPEDGIFKSHFASIFKPLTNLNTYGDQRGKGVQLSNSHASSSH